MAYATKEQMVSRFGEREVIALTDREGTGEIDDTLLADALAEASVEIDGYLSSRFAVPVSPVPKLLVGICCDIARYILSGGDVTETESVRARVNDARKNLGLIRDGKVSIGIDTANQPVPRDGGVAITGGNRTFSRESLGDY